MPETHLLCLRPLAALAATVTVVILGQACSTAPHGSKGSMRSSVSHASCAVIEASELKGAIAGAAPSLVILDVRPEGAYSAGHVPGAVRIDYPRWESDSLSDEYGLENRHLWQSRIGETGIDGRGTIVVYDGGSMTDAARIWFILQSFGASDVRVVNGGFPPIADAARSGAITLSTEPSLPRPAAFAPVDPDADRIAWIGRQELKSAVDAGRVQVLDARSVKEFEGTDLRGNPRGGHLPGATSVPHTSMLDARGRLKSPEELAALFQAAGLAKGEPLVTHCQGGGRAALAALAAARAGYGPVINYYLSFGDWSADATCPVVAP